MGVPVPNQVKSLLHGTTCTENFGWPRPNHFMRILQNFRASAIAIVTIVAMLFVPACGSVCAAMNHCSGPAVSSNPDSCHHSDTAMQAATSSFSFSSAAMCGEQAPLIAALMPQESSARVQSSNTSPVAFSIVPPTYALASHFRHKEPLASNESPQRSIPLENLSILRI